MLRSVMSTAAAATLAYGALSATPAAARDSVPPTPAVEHRAALGCADADASLVPVGYRRISHDRAQAGGTEAKVVLVWRRRVSQDCAQARPLVLPGRRFP